MTVSHTRPHGQGSTCTSMLHHIYYHTRLTHGEPACTSMLHQYILPCKAWLTVQGGTCTSMLHHIYYQHLAGSRSGRDLYQHAASYILPHKAGSRSGWDLYQHAASYILQQGWLTVRVGPVPACCTYILPHKAGSRSGWDLYQHAASYILPHKAGSRSQGGTCTSMLVVYMTTTQGWLHGQGGTV